jgi:hypothetical protein
MMMENDKIIIKIEFERYNPELNTPYKKFLDKNILLLSFWNLITILPSFG